MARSKPSKQLSQAEIDRFLTATEALHKSIVKPLLSPTSDQYRVAIKIALTSRAHPPSQTDRC